MFESMMEYLRCKAANDASAGDPHERKAAQDFLAAYDLWKVEQTADVDAVNNAVENPDIASTPDYFLFDDQN